MSSEFRKLIDLIEQMEQGELMSEAFKIDPELKGAKLKALDNYNVNMTGMIKQALEKAGFEVTGGTIVTKKSESGRFKYKSSMVATATMSTATRKKQDVLGQTSVVPTTVETQASISIDLATHLDQQEKTLNADTFVMDIASSKGEKLKKRAYDRACKVMLSLGFRKLNYPKSDWQSAYTRQDPM